MVERREVNLVLKDAGDHRQCAAAALQISYMTPLQKQKKIRDRGRLKLRLESEPSQRCFQFVLRHIFDRNRRANLNRNDEMEPTAHDLLIAAHGVDYVVNR